MNDQLFHVIIEVEKDLTVRSIDTIDTRDLHFIVRKGGRVTFSGDGAIKIGKSKGIKWPLFLLSGEVIFEAGGWTPSYVDGGPEDRGGLVHLETEDATIMSETAIRYTATSIIVAKTAASSQATDGGGGMKIGQDEHPFARLGALSTTTATDKIKDKVYVNHWTKSAKPVDIDAKEATCHQATENDEGGKTVADQHDDSVATPAALSEAAGTMTTTTNNNSSDYHVPRTGEEDIEVKEATRYQAADGDGGSRMKQDDHPFGKLSPPSKAAETTTTATDKRYMNHWTQPVQRFHHDVQAGRFAALEKDKRDTFDAHSTSSSPFSVGAGGSGGTGGGGCETPASFSHVDSLRAGKPLVGAALRSSDGSSAVWPGSDGSIMYGPVESSAKGSSTTDPPASSAWSTLVPSNKKKLERVMGLRDMVENGQGDGKNDEESVKDRMMAWLPWRRRLKRDLDRARAHHGEVEMSVDQRGGVEVTVDGSPVLTKSGPHSWEWRNRFPWRRRKDPDYEMVATDDGMEVRLHEKRIWGVAADELMD